MSVWYLEKGNPKTIKMLKTLSTNEMVSVHNKLCREKGYGDEIVYDMKADFNDMYPDSLDAIRSAYRADFHPDDYYFYYNKHGNLSSGSFAEWDDEDEEWKWNIDIINLDNIVSAFDSGETIL